MSSEKAADLRPSSRILRRMGLIEDQNGILSRYQGEIDSWEGHLSNTKNFISDCLTSCRPQKIAVLGSGWLLDLPAELLAKHEMVVFYDLRHPEFVRKKYRDQKNFHFELLDVTGGLISKTYNLCRRRKGHDPDSIYKQLQIPGLILPDTFDYVISVNLLNQLDILIIDHIRENFITDQKWEQKVRRMIQENHIKLLPTGQSCLITDYEEVHVNDKNEIMDKTPLVHCTLPSGKYRKTWTWNFDTHRSYHPSFNTMMNVVAIKL